MPTRRRRVVSGDNEWNPLPLGSSEFYNPEPTPIPQRNGGSPSATPRATPTPTPTPANDFYENQRGVTENVPSLTIFPSGPDFAGTEGDNVYAGNFDGDRYGSFPATDTPRLEPSFLFGGPSIEAPTSTGSVGNLDNEPSLFPSATNPFNEWWKTTTDAPSVSVNAGDGGSIWSGNDSLGAFADTSLGNDLNASLGSLGYGEGYPGVPEAAFNPVPDSTGIPIEPDLLNQNTGDTEWTTSPGDRRFLPNAAGESTVEAPRASGNRGGDISSFGTFGSPLTLGGFLNASLSSMRYGEGYPINYGGRPDDLQAGEGYIEPQSQTGGHWVDSPEGQTWVEDSPGSTGFNSTARGASPEVRRAEPVTAFNDPNSYYAGTYFDYGTGHYQQLHEPGSFRDNPNQGAEQMGRLRQTTTDAGHNRFGWEPGAMMFIDDEGGFDKRSVNRGATNPALRGWANLVTSMAGRTAATAGQGGR